MYQTLTYYNAATKKLTPELATSWSSSNHGTIWTFNLRHGVKFHTGRLMTAQAVKAAIERTVALKGGAAYIWDSVSSIDTPTPYTLVFHQKYSFALDLATSSAYGAFIYDTNADGAGNLANWFDSGHDSGTGPYTVKSLNPGQAIAVVLKKFPQYWGGWSGSHYTQVVFEVTPNENTAVQLAESHQVTFVQALTPQLWGKFKGLKGFETPSYTSWVNLFTFYNTAYGPFANLDFRKAVSEAIDYKGILGAEGGGDIRTPGVIPPTFVGYDPNLPEYKTNLKQAKAFLAKSDMAGKSVTLSLTYNTGDTVEATAAVIIKSDLAKLGITVNIRALSTAAQVSMATSPNPANRQDMSLYYWWADYADPYSYVGSLFGTQNPPSYNWSGLSNKNLDSQIGRVESVLGTSTAKAALLYEQMQRELFQLDPGVVLLDLRYEYLFTAPVKGYVDNAAYAGVVLAYQLTPP
jgi:peptide/nickel transport system substrate-binding protein